MSVPNVLLKLPAHLLFKLKLLLLDLCGLRGLWGLDGCGTQESGGAGRGEQDSNPSMSCHRVLEDCGAILDHRTYYRFHRIVEISLVLGMSVGKKAGQRSKSALGLAFTLFGKFFEFRKGAGGAVTRGTIIAAGEVEIGKIFQVEAACIFGFFFWGGLGGFGGHF